MAKDFGIARGQTLKVTRNVQKTILEGDQRFFAIILLEMDLENVDTWKV